MFRSFEHKQTQSLYYEIPIPSVGDPGEVFGASRYVGVVNYPCGIKASGFANIVILIQTEMY